MAKKSKGNRVQVILECTEQKESGVPGMSRYITTKNRKNTPERLELKNYGKENRCNFENRRWSWLCKSNQNGKISEDWCLYVQGTNGYH